MRNRAKAPFIDTFSRYGAYTFGTIGSSHSRLSQFMAAYDESAYERFLPGPCGNLQHNLFSWSSDK
jgi:hypothetical protein